MGSDGTGMPASADTGDAADTASATLGLPGFVVLSAGEYGGELELLVETAERVAGCPRCGTWGSPLTLVRAAYDVDASLVLRAGS